MKRIVDARGLACPQPVVLTLKAIAAAAEVTTVVDNQAAVENVTRLAHSKGCSVEVAEKEDGIYLTLKRRDGLPESTVTDPVVVCSTAGAAKKPPLLFVPSDCLGRGADELGERLMGAFFHSLLDVTPRLQQIIFMNAGVKLTIEGSRALDDLRALAAQGTDILVCGTCLSYFELTETLAVGRISNMYDIATALLEADRVVEL